MPLKYYILLALLICSLSSGAQIDNDVRGVSPYQDNVVNNMIDSLNVEESEYVKRFYDSIKAKTHKRGFTRLLYQSVFRNPPTGYEMGGMFVDESEKYKPYAGKTIGTITINRKQIYEDGVRGLRRYANAVHMLTRESTIATDLLFKSGDRVDPDEIVKNMQILRSRDYLTDATITMMPHPNDSMVVDVIVNTHDRWTISFDGSWRNEGRTMVEVYDANFLGYGNKLSVKTYFNRKGFKYEGNEFQYRVPNLFGTFYKADLKFGRAFEDRIASTRVYKEFILPTDYMLGASFIDETKNFYQLYVDTSAMIKFRRYDAWAGKSFFIRPLKSSIYLTSRYSYIKYRERPGGEGELGPEINPLFHNHDAALFGLGFYREKLYASNMIYGFGYKEYLAAGYKAELVSGYSWGEFRNDIYLGINLEKGGLSPLGYFMGGAVLGSYVDPRKGAWWRSAVDIDAKWVSNLWHSGLSQIRQFVTLNYTKGWNRGTGNNEVITFTNSNGLKTFDEWEIGTSRLLLNTETVVFTPFQPFGFRMAIFGFADFGLLGFDPNPFNNPFYTTLGFGVRLKNERLVFKTLQLRLGVAIGKKGFIHNQYIRVSNEQRLDRYRFIPTVPEIVGFQ